MTRTLSRIVLSAVVAAAAMPASVAFAGKAARGRVVVQNQRIETIRVVIDGELAGMLPAGGRSGFSATEGRHQVRLEDVDGDLILARRVSVKKGERARVRLDAAESTILIDNDAEVAISVKTVDRRGYRRVVDVAPGTERLVNVAPGEVDLRAYRTWFDVDMSLASDELRLEPGEVERYVVQPLDEALVRVDNQSEVGVAVSIGGEHLGRVAAESVGYVMAPVGVQIFDLTTLGVDAGMRRVQVSTESGASFTYIHRVGRMELTNRSRRAARVTVGDKDYGWLRPGQSRSLDLPVGFHEVELRASDGALLKQKRVRVDRDESEYVVFMAGERIVELDLAEAGDRDKYRHTPRSRPAE